jgi:methylated-DNA-[protein]-cysteine S-methyltransferase
MSEELEAISIDDARERSARANAALREAADRAGLVDVAIATMDSPVGELFLAVTGKGVACIAYDDQDREQLERGFAESLSPRVVTSARATDGLRRQLVEYFDGARETFDVPVDDRLMSPFIRKVLRETARVPYGRVSTYGTVAANIARPSAARAVGAALGANPIPIVIPCHRIVGASGRLTGYAGGLQRKEFLLRLEGEPTLGGW